MASKVYERSSVYLDGRRSEPKQLFVDVADRLANLHHSEMKVLDIGCAAGEFADYLSNRLPNATVTGVDIDQKLIDAARQRVPGGTFQCADANDLGSFDDGAFDAVTMTGVHSIFDDFRTSFAEGIRVCRGGGNVVISGLFNEYPIDMLAYWRYASDFEGQYSRGYNVFSKHSVATFLDTLDRVDSFQFAKFELPFDLSPQDDCVRSWTETDGDGKRIFRNGLMVLDFHILTISVAGAL